MIIMITTYVSGPTGSLRPSVCRRRAFNPFTSVMSVATIKPPTTLASINFKIILYICAEIYFVVRSGVERKYTHPAEFAHSTSARFDVKGNNYSAPGRLGRESESAVELRSSQRWLHHRGGGRI